MKKIALLMLAFASCVSMIADDGSRLWLRYDKLQKALEEGGDDATKKQLAQAVKDLDAVRKQYDALKADYDTQKSAHEAELLGVRIDNVMAGATSGLKFKSEFPQAATDTLLAQAVAKVKAMSPEFIDDGKGGKRLVFKGADGEIQRNPENHLEPFTAEELVRRELRQMGILDEGRQQPGTGTTPPKKQQGGTSGAPVDVSMARTQNEAQEIIAQSLMKQGMVNGSKEFQAAMDAAWQENNISALPMS